MNGIFALEFPPVDTLVEWQPLFFEGTLLEVNKVVLLMWLAVALVLIFFFAAAAKKSLVPRGIQNLA